jgi:hypothetical protein
MFPRTRSEVWSGPRKRRAVHFADDSGSFKEILQVAEMELKRMESLEMMSSQKSARKKLFPRHHSDSCIVEMSEQPQLVSGVSDTDLHVGVKEECLNSSTNGVSAEMQNTEVFRTEKESNTLKIQKMGGLLHKSNILNLQGSGRELKVIRKFVKLAPLEVPLFTKKENQVVLTSRDVDCSIIHDMNRSSNDDSGVKPSTQSIHSPSVSNRADSAVLNEAPFVDTTMPKPLNLKPFSQSIQSSSHIKLADGVLHSLNEGSGSTMNVSNIVPKVKHVKKGSTIIELKVPALTQCHILPNNNSGIVIAGKNGDSMLVPSLPIVPKQTGNPASPVEQIDAGGSAAGTPPVAKLYRAIHVGSVVQLVPLCNNSMSLVKQ